ncbi:MAG: roadblock/LC7 domain-containing protein [Deltaproteobacteria bacterium]|jgi:DNA-directed RNA polymerase subunit M/transcription elongation factor TFIIS|nr:roadblock/LC7 domain-containing protein [Deltaproteobacteria bacterium]
MIQFCEDCGEKNFLNSEQMQAGKAVFKCTACSYYNSYNLKIDKKTYSEKLLNLSKTVGIEQYIIVDQKGNIAAHNILNPEKIARIIISCAKNAFAIGKPNMEYVMFHGNNQKKIFIFPAGNSYLGVIKQQNISNITLTNSILNFIKNLGSNTGRLS